MRNRRETVIERDGERVVRTVVDDGRPDTFHLVRSRERRGDLPATLLGRELRRLAEGVTFWPYMDYLVRSGRSPGISG